MARAAMAQWCGSMHLPQWRGQGVDIDINTSGLLARLIKDGESMRVFADEAVCWPVLLCIFLYTRRASDGQTTLISVKVRDIQLVTQASRKEHARKQSRFIYVNNHDLHTRWHCCHGAVVWIRHGKHLLRCRETVKHADSNFAERHPALGFDNVDPTLAFCFQFTDKYFSTF